MEECDEPIQAVIVDDVFFRRFKTLPMDKSLGMMPVGNKYIVDIIIEHLVDNGVTEIFLILGQNGHEVSEHTKSIDYSMDKEVRITTLMTRLEDCNNLGDVLREFDRARFVLSSNFILFNGYCITNINIRKFYELHKYRRLGTKSCVLTALVQKSRGDDEEGGIYHRGELLCLELRTHKHEIVQLTPLNGSDHIAVSAKNIINRVELHLDYSFSSIYFCAHSIPTIFSENFDFQDMIDLIRGLIYNFEIMHCTIHYDVVTTGYVRFVENLKEFLQLNSQILSRIFFPLVPDNWGYNFCNNNQYMGSETKVLHERQLKRRVLVGHRSVFDQSCIFDNTVVGDNCEIGSNVTLKNCVISSSCKIDEDCHLENCFIDNECHIMKNVIIKDMCFLTKNVVVGPDVTISGPCAIVIPNDTSQISVSESDIKILGESSNAVKTTKFLFDILDASSSDSNSINDTADSDEHGSSHSCETYMNTSDDETFSSKPSPFIPSSNISPPTNGTMSETETKFGIKQFHSKNSIRNARKSLSVTIENYDETKNFLAEILDSIRNRVFLNEEKSVDNLVLEINASKHAYNIEVIEVSRSIARACCVLIFHAVEGVDQNEFVTKISERTEKLAPLMIKYFSGFNFSIAVLSVIENFFFENESIRRYYAPLLHCMYEKDILEEQDILHWYQNEECKSTHLHPVLTNEFRKQHLQKFIDWLGQPCESSSEGE